MNFITVISRIIYLISFTRSKDIVLFLLEICNLIYVVNTDFVKGQCIIVICGTNLLATSRWIVYKDIKHITIIPGRDGRLELSLIPYHLMVP